MTVAGSDSAISALEAVRARCEQRGLHSETVQNRPIVVAEADANDQFVEVGKPLLVKHDAKLPGVVPKSEYQHTE